MDSGHVLRGGPGCIGDGWAIGMNVWLAGLLCALLVGCLGSSPQGTPTGSAPSAAESQTSAQPSEAPEGADEWGPLTVIRLDPTGVDLAAAEGEVSITDKCVTLDGMTLVWADSQTRWDAARAVIVFSDPSASLDVEVVDGDSLRLAGGEVGDAFPFVAPRDPSCPSTQFGVGAISEVNGVTVDR